MNTKWLYYAEGYSKGGKAFLERIAHCQVEALIFLKAWNIIEPSLAGIVWQVQTDTPIHTYHKHAHIVTNAYACAYRQLLVERAKLERFFIRQL